mgnify:CR=1 FL=1
MIALNTTSIAWVIFFVIAVSGFVIAHVIGKRREASIEKSVGLEV